jgi:alkaline phosphatase D
LLERRLDRRTLLAGGVALLGWPAFARAFGGLTPRFQANPFTLGVASGDPLPSSVVLWTRLAPDPLNGGGMPPSPVEVSWIVAADEQLTRVVKRGRATARPEWAHAVHVEATGLDPDRWYWYQFRTGDHVSAKGRTRTLPRAGAAAARLRFAFCSCQHYETGYFTAYRHMAREDVDLVFHLGDYIYESAERAPTATRPRSHHGPELTTLEHYRNRYAQYRTDADLQAGHAAFPWIATWDDHEVANNYAGQISDANDPTEVFLARRAAAYRAYYEHMPLRPGSMPDGPSLRLYRNFVYGNLASFFVLDTRQYRTDQPCGDRLSPPCDATVDPKATLLGRDQASWLFDGLDDSRAQWNVIPQQVMLANLDRRAGEERWYNPDHWAGYEAERARLMEFLAQRRPANPVVLTGDIHSNWVNDLKANYLDERAPVIGTELACTSISSGGDGSDMVPPQILAENPHVKFYNSQRGYVRCDMTPKSLEATYQIVPFVTRPDAPLSTRAKFVVESGRPGAQRVS